MLDGRVNDLTVDNILNIYGEAEIIRALMRRASQDPVGVAIRMKEAASYDWNAGLAKTWSVAVRFVEAEL